MILTKDDYNGLTEVLGILNRIVKNAVMSELEEAHEQKFNKFFNLNGVNCVQNIVSKTLVQEVKEMMIELKIPGSVRERKNGLIEARTLYFGSVYGRTKEELNAKLSAKITEIIAPDKSTTKSKRQLPLFSEFYNNSYLPYKKGRKKIAASTLNGYKYRMSAIIQKGFDKKINSYTPQKIENFLMSIEKTRTRQIMQGFLNNVFTRAVVEGLIKINPCSSLEKMEHGGNVGTAFAFDEQKRFFLTLFASNMSYALKCYFVFVYLTGTRRNEALAASASDFNPNEKILQINGTKTDGSFRYMPVFPLLEKLLLSLPFDGKYFPFSGKTVDVKFKKIVASLNLKHKLHNLRHTFGTVQICCNKIDVKTVSLWMGHSTVDTTLNRYTHPEQLDKATFLRGDLSEDEKNATYKAKYTEIMGIIKVFLNDRTHYCTH